MHGYIYMYMSSFFKSRVTTHMRENETSNAYKPYSDLYINKPLNLFQTKLNLAGDIHFSQAPQDRE